MKPCPNLDCEAWHAGESRFGCRACQKSRAWLRSLGVCSDCREPYTGPGMRCEECKKKSVEAVRKLRSERKMNLVCLDCKAPACKGQLRCLAHKLRHARYQRERVFRCDTTVRESPHGNSGLAT